MGETLLGAPRKWVKRLKTQEGSDNKVPQHLRSLSSSHTHFYKYSALSAPMISSVLPLNPAPHSRHTARRRKWRRNSMTSCEEHFLLYPDLRPPFILTHWAKQMKCNVEISTIEHLVCTLTLRGRSATSRMKARSYDGNGIRSYDSCDFCVAGLLCRSVVTSQRKTRKSSGQKSRAAALNRHISRTHWVHSGFGQEVDVRGRYKRLCGGVSEADTQAVFPHSLWRTDRVWRCRDTSS